MKRILTLAALSLLCVSCFPTRIVTYTPAATASYYTTSVTAPRSNTTTYVSQVNAKNSDISLHLDLQAVGALYSQSSTVQEFEQLLNSQTYPVSNLDLNNDGYIDYLRVLETVSGYNHVYLIQALLSTDVYQDVATIVVERPAYSDYCVEIIGAPYIYGPSYIVRPRFIARPLIFDHICRVGYSPWHSPWYWDHFPSHYRHHGPMFLNHYQSYVHTFVSGHRFCREVFYPAAPHFPGYSDMARPYCRNDYGNRYPERSFTVRNANTPRIVSGGGSAGSVRNAYDIRMNNESTKYTTTSVTGRGSSQSSTVTRNGGTTTSFVTSGSATRSANVTSSSATRGTAATSGSTTRGTTASSSTTTRGTTTTSSSTSRGTTSGSSSVTRGTTTSSSSATRGTTTSSSSMTRSSSTSSATRSTGTVSSSVRSSGSATTTRSATATSPRTSSSSSSASRSSSSSSTSRSSSAGSSTRSSSSRGSR